MAIQMSEGGGMIITGKDDVSLYRLATMVSCLRLEIKGIKMVRHSVYAQAKREFGFKGNKVSVLAQLEAHFEAVKAARIPDPMDVPLPNPN